MDKEKIKDCLTDANAAWHQHRTLATITIQTLDALESITYAMLAQHHGMRMAQAVKDNGWQWPEDAPRHVDIRLDNALAALRTLSDRNQCDGCRRGMPLSEHGTHYDESTGTPYMVCTSDRYPAPVSQEAWSAAAPCQLKEAARLLEQSADPFDKACSILRSLIDSGDYVLIRQDVVDFLHGTAPLDGEDFSDRQDRERGRYWWRRLLPPYSRIGE